jgi:hypothetical protein
MQKSESPNFCKLSFGTQFRREKNKNIEFPKVKFSKFETPRHKSSEGIYNSCKMHHVVERLESFASLCRNAKI